MLIVESFDQKIIFHFKNNTFFIIFYEFKKKQRNFQKKKEKESFEKIKEFKKIQLFINLQNLQLLFGILFHLERGKLLNARKKQSKMECIPFRIYF